LLGSFFHPPLLEFKVLGGWEKSAHTVVDPLENVAVLVNVDCKKVLAGKRTVRLFFGQQL
jgi:hypothetical protein